MLVTRARRHAASAAMSALESLCFTMAHGATRRNGRPAEGGRAERTVETRRFDASEWPLMRSPEAAGETRSERPDRLSSPAPAADQAAAEARARPGESRARAHPRSRRIGEGSPSRLASFQSSPTIARAPTRCKASVWFVSSVSPELNLQRAPSRCGPRGLALARRGRCSFYSRFWRRQRAPTPGRTSRRSLACRLCTNFLKSIHLQPSPSSASGVPTARCVRRRRRADRKARSFVEDRGVGGGGRVVEDGRLGLSSVRRWNAAVRPSVPYGS